MGVWRFSSTIPDSALDGEFWAPRFGRFTPGKRAHCTHRIGGWMSPRAGLNTAEKRKISCRCRELNPDCSARSPSLHRLSYTNFWNCNIEKVSRKVLVLYFSVHCKIVSQIGKYLLYKSFVKVNRSLRQRGRKRVLSSTSRTLESRARILLDTRMHTCVSSALCWRVKALRWVLPALCKIRGFRSWLWMGIGQRANS
jgi:hypothetical protein